MLEAYTCLRHHIWKQIFDTTPQFPMLFLSYVPRFGGFKHVELEFGLENLREHVVERIRKTLVQDTVKSDMAQIAQMCKVPSVDVDAHIRRLH